MKTKIAVALLAAGVGLAGQASAQDTMLDYVVDACADDLAEFCSDVTPGEGRILHCVAAYQDQLSGQCEYALYEAATLLQQLTAAIVYVAESCETEIETLCSEVEAGEGRILACLAENDDEIGDTCRQSIADTTGE